MAYLLNDAPDTLAAFRSTFYVQPIPKDKMNEGTVEIPDSEIGDVPITGEGAPAPYATPPEDLGETKEFPNPGLLIPASDIDSSEDLFYGPQTMDNVCESFQKASDLVVPDAILEAAMPAKERNALDDGEFGLPDQRKYPLHDRKHVLQAIRMFGHVKVEQDRKRLAAAIVKKHDEFKMTAKVGKNNPLYNYVPNRMKLDSVNEASAITVYGFAKKHEARSKSDIVMEHLRMNNSFYNNLFYSTDYAEALKKIHDYQEMKYLDYFHPSFKIHNFQSRTKTALGGLYEALWNGDHDEKNEVLSDMEKLRQYIEINYYEDANWYRVSVKDPVHIAFCMKLYDVIRHLLNRINPVFTSDMDVVTRWKGNVEYHHALMKECTEGTNAFFVQCQYLHDLFWDPCDDPRDVSICGSCVVSFLNAMDPSTTGSVNESGEMVQKQDVLGYLAKELKDEHEDIYLIPYACRYPVIDPTSLRLAMDFVTKVDEEDLDTFTNNLNLKYRQFNCDFKIPVDHPYAKYAEEDMLEQNHSMFLRVLSESDGNPPTKGMPKKYKLVESFYYSKYHPVYIEEAAIVHGKASALGKYPPHIIERMINIAVEEGVPRQQAEAIVQQMVGNNPFGVMSLQGTDAISSRMLYALEEYDAEMDRLALMSDSLVEIYNKQIDLKFDEISECCSSIEAKLQSMGTPYAAIAAGAASPEVMNEYNRFLNSIKSGTKINAAINTLLMKESGISQEDIKQHICSCIFTETSDPEETKKLLQLRQNYNNHMISIFQQMLKTNYLSLGYSKEEADSLVAKLSSSNQKIRQASIVELKKAVRDNADKYRIPHGYDFRPLGGGIIIYQNEGMGEWFDINAGAADHYLQLALRWDCVIVGHGGAAQDRSERDARVKELFGALDDIRDRLNVENDPDIREQLYAEQDKLKAELDTINAGTHPASRKLNWTIPAGITLPDGKTYVDGNELVRALIRQGHKKIYLMSCNPGHAELAPDIKRQKGVIIHFAENVLVAESFVGEGVEPLTVSEINMDMMEDHLQECCQYLGVSYNDDKYLDEAYEWGMSVDWNNDLLNEGVIERAWKIVCNIAKKVLSFIVALFRKIVNFFRRIIDMIRNVFRGARGSGFPEEVGMSYIMIENASMVNTTAKNWREMEQQILSSCDHISAKLRVLEERQTEITKQTAEYANVKSKEVF